MSLESSLVRILKNPANRMPEGAGVYIGRRQVLTCTHVVRAVVQNMEHDTVFLDFPLLESRGPFAAKVVPGRYFEINLTPDINQPEDICLLEIDLGEKLSDNLKPAEFIETDHGFSDRTVRTCGFPELHAEGEHAEGRLKGPTARGWIQLDADLTSRTVAPGYSGAPVWDKQADKAAGIIVSRSDRAGKVVAYMIPAVQLAQLAPHILTPRSDAPAGCLHSSLIWKCDRDTEVVEFTQYLEANRQSFSCRHHLFLIPGGQRACHLSLSKRFTHSKRVCNALEKCLSRAVIPKHDIIPWPPAHAKAKNGMNLLLTDLFRQFDEDYAGEMNSEYFVELCRYLNLREHGVIILAHKIPFSSLKQSVAILNEYIDGFWGRIPSVDELPVFFLSFDIEIESASGFIARLRYRKINQLMQNTFAAMLSDSEKRFNGRQFEELRTVTRHDVENWFFRHCRHVTLSERLIREGVDIIFRNKTEAAMAEVENWLEEVVETVNRQRGGLQAD